MIFALVQDFADALAAMPAGHPRRRVLELVSDAVSRDVHFIDRHPTTLFQCLWNSCWWYDCPEAAAHFPRHTDRGLLGRLLWAIIHAIRRETEEFASYRGTGVPPWETPGRPMSKLAEAWRAARSQAQTGGPWLRSLRPPATNLGSAQRIVLRGHEGKVYGVCFSPDGRRVVTASDDRTARVWDAATGAPVRRLAGHADRVTGVCHSADGRWIATASLDKTARVWDAATGAEALRLAGHTGGVHGVCFSPDSRRLATASEDGTACVWDAETGAEVVRFAGHAEWVTSVCFSPDARRVLTGAWDETARVWDAETGAEVCVLRGHSGGLNGVCFSPDGRRAATTAQDGSARLWHGGTWDRGAGGPATLAVDLLAFTGVCFSPDGRRIAAATRNAVQVVDAAGGSDKDWLRGHGDGVNGVCFSPDGRWIATASDDGTARVWDAAGGDEPCVRRGDGHSAYVDFAPAGQPGGTFHCRVVRIRLVESFMRGDSDILRLEVRESAAVSPRPPSWKPILSGLDTRLDDAATGLAVAWFPAASRNNYYTASPSGRIWHWNEKSDILHLVALEDPPAPPDGRSIP